jgi:hypothetical protein
VKIEFAAWRIEFCVFCWQLGYKIANSQLFKLALGNLKGLSQDEVFPEFTKNLRASCKISKWATLSARYILLLTPFLLKKHLNDNFRMSLIGK